jgi:molecular chaperone GrpE (heat shock protein)
VAALLVGRDASSFLGMATTSDDETRIGELEAEIQDLRREIRALNAELEQSRNQTTRARAANWNGGTFRG